MFIEKPIVLSCQRKYPNTSYVLKVYGKYELEAEVSYNNSAFVPIEIMNNEITISNKPIGMTFQVRLRNKKDNDYSEWYYFNKIKINSIYETYTQHSTNPQNPNFYENDFNLFDGISNEVVQKRGINCIYLPKKLQKFDLILGEDVLKKFEDTYMMKMYLASVTGFEGDNDMFGKFGLHVDDVANLEVNQTEFHRATNGIIPVCGDLIYIPNGDYLMELFNFLNEDPFYLLGKCSRYVFQVRKYDYSHEEMDTTVEKLNTLNDYDSTDIISENDLIENNINDLLNRSNPNIFGDR